MQPPITSRDTTMRMLRQELSGSLWLHRYAVIWATQRLGIVDLNQLLDAVVEARSGALGPLEPGSKLPDERFSAVDERFWPTNGRS